MSHITHPTCQIPRLPEFLERYFPDKTDGYFVEVGAFDGMTYSNTWGLTEIGWGGLYVEAHPDFARQCIHNHGHNPKITTVSAACGAEEGEAELIVYGEVSTLNLSKWNRQWGMNDDTPKIKVPKYTLETLLYLNKIDSFDLLVVDTEETEIEVLKGFNLHAHRPKMAIIELHEKQGTRIDEKGWQEPWVTNYFKGYQKIYADQINTIFIRNT